MKVRYGKAKTAIVFGVGGVIVAMVTTFFCGSILQPVTSAVFTRLSWNLAHRTNITWRCEKLNFRNCYAKRCHGNHTSGKIISFSFSFCSFYPIGMEFGTQDRYNMALRFWCGWSHRCHGNNIFLWKYSRTCNFCCFYPIVKFGTQDQYNMALWKIEFSELLRQALPWQPHIGKNNFIFL